MYKASIKNITTLYVDVLVSNSIKKKLTYKASYNYNNDKNIGCNASSSSTGKIKTTWAD